jgi:hypothetical protein
MQKSDLSVKKVRRNRLYIGKTEEREEKGEKRGDGRMMSGDGKNRQNKKVRELAIIDLLPLVRINFPRSISPYVSTRVISQAGGLGLSLNR